MQLPYATATDHDRLESLRFDQAKAERNLRAAANLKGKKCCCRQHGGGMHCPDCPTHDRIR